MRTLFYLLILAFFLTCSQSRSPTSRPKPLSSLQINKNQTAGKCSFTFSVRTSCSSPRFTRDHISLSFGDASGNQIYAPRLDDPDFRTFERCATDTFDKYGPCTDNICYVNLYRSGNDGWVPTDVTVYAYNMKPVTFKFNVNIPKDTWYASNTCSGK